MKKILCILMLLPALVFAWTPTKPVTVMYGFGPGSGNEMAFRIVSEIVERQTGVTFVPEYKPGASGNLVMAAFEKAEPDGYTISVPSCSGTWVLSEAWYPQVKFNLDDLVLVTHIAKSPLAVFANAKSTTTTPKQLVKRITDGTPVNIALGAGGHQLAVEYILDYLQVREQNNVVPVLYRGPSQAIMDVVSGQVEFGIVPLAVGYPHVQSGALKIVGLTNESTMPGIQAPLMSSVIPQLYQHGCWNIVLPPGTPARVQQWYTEQFNRAINSAEAQAKFAQQMMYTTASWQSPQGLKAAMQDMQRTWTPVARRLTPR